MLKSKMACLAGLAGCALLMGCGGASDQNVPALPPAAPPAEISLSSEDTDAAPLPSEATPLAQTEAEPLKMVDDEGNALTALGYLQQAVSTYERSRPGTETETGPGWPPLTDLSQLVKYRIIRGIPPAPAGQRFVFNPETGKVGLANQ